jgi:integration host factor subunit beta
MNRSDLVQLLCDRFSQLTQWGAETAVSTILEAMNSAMVRGHRIEIRGFGSFSVIHRASRMGRNPRSGAPVEIPAARMPHFKPGKALREAVDLPTDGFIAIPHDEIYTIAQMHVFDSARVLNCAVSFHGFKHLFDRIIRCFGSVLGIEPCSQ